ncbi:hypothetical protein, partial [Nocardia sp. NPDC052112]|uniref:hypothetical protein n=1 Tax=Nocardia sp. NPDC052112 TaxID=3155646 RepID=UPI00341BFFBB
MRLETRLGWMAAPFGADARRAASGSFVRLAPWWSLVVGRSAPDVRVLDGLVPRLRRMRLETRLGWMAAPFGADARRAASGSFVRLAPLWSLVAGRSAPDVRVGLGAAVHALRRLGWVGWPGPSAWT